MRSIKECLEEYRQGNRLSNEELVRLYLHMKNVSCYIGEMFTFFTVYADKVARDCYHSIEYRNILHMVEAHEKESSEKEKSDSNIT